MTTLISPDEHSAPLRVSVLARLVPGFGYILVAIGAGVSAVLLAGVMHAMREAEAAGLAAVSVGIVEANVPVLIPLYLAILFGFAGIVVAVARFFVTTKTASPSTLLLLIGGVLTLFPVALLWCAESMLVQAISPAGAGQGVAYVASTIDLLLKLTMIAAPISCLLLVAGSVWPLSSRSRPRWGPIVILVAIEVALIIAAVVVQLRTSWLYQVRFTERM